MIKPSTICVFLFLLQLFACINHNQAHSLGFINAEYNFYVEISGDFLRCFVKTEESNSIFLGEFNKNEKSGLFELINTSKILIAGDIEELNNHPERIRIINKHTDSLTILFTRVISFNAFEEVTLYSTSEKPNWSIE